MPVNPNIALGIQPVQQPNILGQMGQIMAIRQAQQEMEGSEDVRNYFAKPTTDRGDPSQLLATKQGQAAFKALNESQLKQLEIDQKRVNLVGASAGAVLNNPTMETFTTVVSDLVKRGIYTPEQRDQAFAAVGNDPSKIKAFVTPIYEQAISAEKRLSDITSRRNTDVSAAAPLGQLALAQKKFDLEQAQQAELAKILRGEAPTGAPAVIGAPMGGGGGAASSSIFNPASANVLADQAAPSATTPAPVNGLLNPPAGQTGVAPGANRAKEIEQQLTQLSKISNPAANQAMERLIKEYNVLNPEGEIKQNASGALVTVNRRTNVATPILDKDGKPVMGSLPYETAFATKVGTGQGERNERVVLAAQAAVDNIAKIDSTIELLKTGDATTGLGAELRNNIDRARALFAGDIKAGKKVADTQILDALLGSDVFSMIQSLGIGARGLDTPAERDYLRQVMTGTIQMDNKALIRLSEIRRNIETRAIEKYNTQLDKGELKKYFETQGIKPEKIEVPTASGGAGSNTVSVGGVTYTFPNAEAAAKFKKEAGVK